MLLVLGSANLFLTALLSILKGCFDYSREQGNGTRKGIDRSVWLEEIPAAPLPLRAASEASAGRPARPPHRRLQRPMEPPQELSVPLLDAPSRL